MGRSERGMLAGFLFAVLAVAAMLLLVFAAWGRATEDRRPSGAARLLFTGWGGVIERGVFADLVREFERRNPEIDVEYRPVPRDYMLKLKTSFGGGMPPDVFYLPDGDFPGFAGGGQVLNLQPFVDRSQVIRTEDFWESGLRRYRFDGHVFGQGPLYALPKDIGPTVMYVNMDLLRSSGIPLPSPDKPLDWNEALALWKGLTRDWDGDGRIDQWGTHGIFLEMAVRTNGGDFLSPDGRRFTMPDDPRAMEAAEWLIGLQTVHRVAPMERHRKSISTDTLFLTGRLATFVGGRWQVPLFRKAEFAWDVVPIPVSPHTRKQAGWSGSVGLAIAPSCAHKEAAWRLVEFLTGPEGQRVQAPTGFQIPNQRSLSRTEIFLQSDQPPANAEVFLEAARTQDAAPPTRTPNDKWWATLHQALGPAYRGEVTVRDAVNGAREEVQAALDQAWRTLQR